MHFLDRDHFESIPIWCMFDYTVWIMTMISSAITSTATRAAMMAMPIVDITTEKLSSISQIDMNRKVNINFWFWLGISGPLCPVLRSLILIILFRIQNGNQIMKVKNHWFIVREKMFIIIWWRHRTVLLTAVHIKVAPYRRRWRYVNGRQHLTLSELPSDSLLVNFKLLIWQHRMTIKDHFRKLMMKDL